MHRTIQGDGIASLDDFFSSSLLRLSGTRDEHLTSTIRTPKFLQQQKSCRRALHVVRNKQEMRHGELESAPIVSVGRLCRSAGEPCCTCRLLMTIPAALPTPPALAGNVFRKPALEEKPPAESTAPHPHIICDGMSLKEVACGAKSSSAPNSTSTQVCCSMSKLCPPGLIIPRPVDIPVPQAQNPRR